MTAPRLHFAGLAPDALAVAPFCGGRRGLCVEELRRVTCVRCVARFGRASMLAWRLTVLRFADELEAALKRLDGAPHTAVLKGSVST